SQKSGTLKEMYGNTNSFDRKPQANAYLLFKRFEFSMSQTGSSSLSPPPTCSAESRSNPLRNSFRYSYCAIGLLVIIAVLAWHARETLTRFPPGLDEESPLPFLQYDHPFHYYYSQVTADFFSRRRSFWGYDPNFMAGYAKTMIFPTG